jgi:hypothetical protein
MKRISSSKVAILATFGALLAASASLANIGLMNMAAASPAKTVEGLTPCCGYTSTLICADGTTYPQPNQDPPVISFGGNKVNSGSLHTQGMFFSIRAASGEIFGGGNIAQISPNKFQLQGTMDSDGLCNSKVPSNVILSGQCGFGVSVKYEAANGDRATFSGINVACQG